MTPDEISTVIAESQIPYTPTSDELAGTFLRYDDQGHETETDWYGNVVSGN